MILVSISLKFSVLFVYYCFLILFDLFEDKSSDYFLEKNHHGQSKVIENCVGHWVCPVSESKGEVVIIEIVSIVDSDG